MDTYPSARTITELASDSHENSRVVRLPLGHIAALLTVALAIPMLLLSCSKAQAGSASLEPCSVLSPEEAATVLKGPVKQEVPSPIRYKGISTGGTCVYRLRNDPLVTITVRVDATPNGAQRRRFEAGLRRAPAAELSGVGDRAYTEIRPKGPQSVTFLHGDTLTTVTVESLSISEAKQVAALVASRLPTSITEPSSFSAASSPSAASTQGSGKLDPALVGSWFLKQPDGRGLANLRVERDGRFNMTLLAGNKQQRGRIDGENGVLHLYPDRGGPAEELRYQIVDKNQMEWIDRNGNVAIARRQFR